MKLKEAILSKMAMDVAYTVANFLSSAIASFLVKDAVQVFLGNVFVNATLKPGAQEFLDHYLGTAIMGLLMVSGSVAIHFFHKHVMLPKVIVPNSPEIQAVQQVKGE